MDAVAIVTPASTHFSLVKESLESDKHVIVEKPLSFSSREAEELIKTADERSDWRVFFDEEERDEDSPWQVVIREARIRKGDEQPRIRIVHNE